MSSSKKQAKKQQKSAAVASGFKPSLHAEFSKKLRQAKIRVEADGSAVIEGSEYISTIEGNGVNPAGDPLYAFYLGFDKNQLVYFSGIGTEAVSAQSFDSLNSRLSYLAQAWEKWKLEEMVFEYVPTTSVTSSGSIIMSTDTDPMDALDTAYSGSGPDIRTCLCRENAVMTQVFEPARHRVPIDRAAHYYVHAKGDNSANVSAAVDVSQVRLSNAGLFWVTAAGPLSTGTMGVLICHYRLRVMQPTIPEPIATPTPSIDGEITFALSGAPNAVPNGSLNGSISLADGNFVPINKYDSSETFVPCPFWNYTSNTFNKSGVYAIEVDSSVNGYQGNTSAITAKQQLNTSATYSDTPAGDPPTFTFGGSAPSGYGAKCGTATISQAQTGSQSGGSGVVNSVASVVRTIAVNAGDSLASYFWNTALSGSPGAVGIPFAIGATRYLIRYLAGATTALFRRIRAGVAEAPEDIKQWLLHYRSVHLLDDGNSADVIRASEYDSRFAEISQNYQERFAHALTYDCTSWPEQSTAVDLYNELYQEYVDSLQPAVHATVVLPRPYAHKFP